MAGKKAKSKKDAVSVITPPESATDEPSDRKNKNIMDTDEAETAKELKVYLPGMDLAEGEELEVDLSAYVMLHELNVEWPCLSFDVVRDNGGEERTAFPMEGYLVTGTQADSRNKNQLYLLRYTNLHKTLQREEQEDEDEEEDENSDDEEGEEDPETIEKKNPRHYGISIPHDGGVNRIRSTNVVEGGELKHVLTATWADTGRVHIWDLHAAHSELEALSLDSTPALSRHLLKPFHTVTTKQQRSEGFALAWSPLSVGQLLAGDIQGHISMTNVSGQGVTTDDLFKGHTGSVEDLQWAPNEATVFASSSTDGTVRLWDIRLPRHQSALAGHVHSSDVNVLSWNRHATHLLATGADDGQFATWDLRTWSPSSDILTMRPIITQDWHRGAVTSIEWNPHDASVLAVAGADDQLTIWDFAIEANPVQVVASEESPVPDQLLFIHQGQKEIKELHWHPQLSGVLISTALTGFNIFKTISI